MTDKAILFGINDYQKIGNLRGCINDIKNLKSLLIEQYGFDEEDIRTFYDEDVIKKNIIEQWAWLIEGASEGDRLVFHFSGHGSFVNSTDNDEPIDEILCLYDMDFNNPDTYMVDDEMGALTRELGLEAGATLTVILDSCHSGTGTRAVTKNDISGKARFIEKHTIECLHQNKQINTRSINRDSTALLQAVKEHDDLVIMARMVNPPSKMMPRGGYQNINRFGSFMKRMREERALGDPNAINHQLVSSADEDQTAADAFINGSFNGAFSYYLCETARSLGRVTDEGVIFIEASGLLTDHNYEQTPQNEGPFSDCPLFGSVDGHGSSITGDDLGRNKFSSLLASGTTNNRDLLDLLLRDHYEMMKLASHLAGVDASQSDRETGRFTQEDVVLYVHGINHHASGYSDDWYDALTHHIPASNIGHEEVVWSDIVNPRGLTLSAKEEKLKKDYLDQLEDRLQQLRDDHPQKDQRSVTSARAIVENRGNGFMSDDAIRYMSNTNTRAKIIKRFTDELVPLLRSGKRVHIISHSWGTVVAWEGLRSLDGQGFAGEIKNLFLCGSALSSSIVRENLFGRIGDGRKPQLVNKTLNLDAGGDIVGGSIKRHFTTDFERTSLKPVPCDEIPFTNIAINPVCAHRCYFKKENIGINRDIFAKFIK